jgi:thiamine pyrophosphate-dependent acetolactate synthase large subunit-like protein
MTRAFSWLGKGAQAKQKKDLLNYLGDPDVSYTLIAKAYGVDAEEVTDPSGLNAAFKRALRANDDGRPYLLDVSNERWGAGGELTWHPDYSIAKMRSSRA